MSISEIKNGLLQDIIVSNLAESNNITLEEARKIVADMSFLEYHRLCEATITPPSGQTIGPTSTAGTNQQQQTPAAGNNNVKSIWPGKGAPVEIGMTVGLKDPSGKPVPGQISQVDKSANGAKVKNPITGKDEWMNLDALQPFMAQGAKQQNPQQPQQQATQQQIKVAEELARMKELAGIAENCSGGATGAGAIAIAPASMGKVKRRQPTEEEVKKEYTPKHAAKTIVGDTKPNQASGELSATLAANGKKTASRRNNGFKR